jgi:hypothetical protein
VEDWRVFRVRFLLPKLAAWSCGLGGCVDRVVLAAWPFFLKQIRLSMTYPLKTVKLKFTVHFTRIYSLKASKVQNWFLTAK